MTGFLHQGCSLCASIINSIQFLASSLLGFFSTFLGLHSFYPAVEINNNNAVLITGTSSGIGLQTAVNLASKGFLVIACVRKEGDVQRLSTMHKNIMGVKCDITKDSDVAELQMNVLRTLRDRNARLCAVVNNAGVMNLVPVEKMSIDEFTSVVDVIVTGAIRITTAFLPQLRESKGRVVFIGSVLGFTGAPTITPYCAAKGALEMVADCLRRELLPFNISVSLIQPGAICSPMFEKVIAYNPARQNEIANSPYQNKLDRIKTIFKGLGQCSSHSSSVSDCIDHAVTSSYPLTRYLVGGEAWIVYMLSFMPTRVVDSLINMYYNWN